jgi:hypothetical protein
VIPTAADLAQTYPRIPFGTLDQLVAYRDGAHPRPFGQFVTAVLANDFTKAVLRADPVNFAAIKDYARFVHNELTPESWGSYEKVRRTIALQEHSGVLAGAV